MQDELIGRRERTRPQGERATVDEDLVLVRDRGAGEGVQARKGLIARALLGQREAGRLEDEFGESRPGRRSRKGDGLGDFVDAGDGDAGAHAGAEDGHAGDNASDVGHSHRIGRRQGTRGAHARRTAEDAGVGGILEAVAEGKRVEDGRDGRTVGQGERTVADQATEGDRGQGAEREEAGVAIADDDVRVLQGQRIVEDELSTRDAGLAIEGVRAIAQREVGRTGFRERQCPEASRQTGIDGGVGGGVEGERRGRALRIVEHKGGVRRADDVGESLVEAVEVEPTVAGAGHGDRRRGHQTIGGADDESTLVQREFGVRSAAGDPDVAVAEGEAVVAAAGQEARFVDVERARDVEVADATDWADEDAAADVTGRLVRTNADRPREGRDGIATLHHDGAVPYARRAAGDGQVVGEVDAIAEEQAAEARAVVGFDADQARAEGRTVGDEQGATTNQRATGVGIGREEGLRTRRELHQRTRAGNRPREGVGLEGEVRSNG